jgi:signal transduction histidine kinase
MSSSGLPSQSSSAFKRIRSYFKFEGEQMIRITVFVIIFVMLLTFILAEGVDLPAWRFYGTIIALTIILVINILEDRVLGLFSHENNGRLAFLILTGALMLIIAWLGHFINVIYLYFMIAAQAFITLPFRTALAVVLGTASAYLILLWGLAFNLESLISIAAGMSVGLVFVGTLSTVLSRYAEQTRRAERLAQELQQVNADLQAARQHEAELAVAEERVRLARDIHDGLGHHLTVLNIQLQAAAKFIERNPVQAAEVIATCREEARLALEEVRQSVAVMRRSPLDGKSLQAALHTLVEGYNRGATLKADLQVKGSDIDLPPVMNSTIYRAVQESLTNAQKHAQNASRIEVTLEFFAQWVHLVIRDDGQNPHMDHTTTGFGLAGLQERAEQLGGSFEAKYIPDQGYQIEMTIPYREADHD